MDEVHVRESLIQRVETFLMATALGKKGLIHFGPYEHSQALLYPSRISE